MTTSMPQKKIDISVQSPSSTSTADSIKFNQDSLKINKGKKKVSFSRQLSVVYVESYKKYNTMQVVGKGIKTKTIKCECIIY